MGNPRLFRSAYILFVLILFDTGLQAQPLSLQKEDSLQNSFTDISRIQMVNSILKTVSSTYIGKKEDPEKEWKLLKFIPGVQHVATVPPDFVTKKLLLQFNLCNNEDSGVSVYFFPGTYYQDIQLYRIEGRTPRKIPPILPDLSDSVGYRLLTLAAHDSASILAELTFLKTYINSIRPRLVNPQYLPSFIAELRATSGLDNLVTYIFCGLLLMMILFSVTNFFQGANKEFLYYSGYAFFLGTMLFTKALYEHHTNPVNFFFESYLDFILQGLGIIFYMIFMKGFLDTRHKHRFLFHLYNTGIAMLILSMVSYSGFHYFTDNYTAENQVENATKIILLAMILIFLVYSARNRKDKLMGYLFWGNFLLFVFALLSQVSIMLNDQFRQFPGIFHSSLFYYELGLFLELLFFLAGLNYKNRRYIIAQTKEREALKAQNRLQEFEKEVAVYKAHLEERQRISADMHDELGAGMTAIRLMSEIARNKMKENTPVEIEKISSSADDVLNKMNAIIWSMNSGNDTLDNLISYIRSYSLEYFENTPVACEVLVPENIPEKELSGDKRRNLFLCVKETLNNVLKHANASRVSIRFVINHGLIIQIADNGTGIDLQHLRTYGNGLKNITHRMENIGGSFTIENRNGTLTTLELPI